MATAGQLRHKSAQDTAEWLSLFQNELETEQQSVVFVKRMMALAVSCITYLRGIFPEDAYRSRYLEDLCIKVLRENSSSPGACKIVKWMMGYFDALEKGYLQIVFIGVHTDPGDPNHIIESYQFKFKYTEDGPHMEILRNRNDEMKVTMEDTKKASVLLVRKLFLLMQNLDVLPTDVCLSMKLYYYDEVTPPDYEPPGFRQGRCDTLWFDGTAVHFKVGDVQTPFHTMKVQVAAEHGRVAGLQQGSHLWDSAQTRPGRTASRTGAGQLPQPAHSSATRGR
ncbi:zebrafish testis-expressed 38 [Anguilla rostrata]|uniref:zebrafish testis-expressed 38 n=1 Tax=Anguilla rostrata TaxID=7938 RepID=UPI0030CD57A4